MLTAWIQAERGRFVLFLPVCMAGGVALYFTLGAEPPLWLALLLAAAGLGAALLTPGRWRWGLAARAAALALAFAAIGLASARLAARHAAPWPTLPRHAAVLEGEVTTVEALPTGRRISLAHPALDGGAPLARAVRLRLRRDDAAGVAAGDIVRIRALLRPPPPPAYPGGWDMRRDAFFDGVAGFGFAIGPLAILRAGPMQRLAALRDTMAARARAALPGERGAIAAVLLTGEGAAIPPAERQAFADSGLAHLLAVAGLHVGIVMGIVWMVARRGLALSEWLALHWPLKAIAAVASLAAGAGYAVLTGAHIPILRSFAMASVVVLGILTGRRSIGLRAWALAAVALILAAPASVMSASFQMSFAAVLALIAGFEALPRAAAREAPAWRRLALRVGLLAMTSVLAGTASLPFAAYHFGRATLFYVPANLLAVPITAFWVMPWCLAALPLMPVGLERLALAPAGLGIGALVWLARFVAGWPNAALPVPQMPPTALALFALGLAWLGLWRSRARLAGVGAMAAACLVWVAAPRPDLFVAPDARVIAARVDGRVLADAAHGASTFEAEAPARLWGLPAAPACDGAACDWILPGGIARLLRDPDQVACTGAAVLLAAFPLRGACPGVPRIDRFSVWRDGAAVITLRAGAARIVQTDPAIGARPWVIGHAPAAPLLPMAATE